MVRRRKTTVFIHPTQREHVHMKKAMDELCTMKRPPKGGILQAVRQKVKECEHTGNYFWMLGYVIGRLTEQGRLRR